ncbi:uncharacterized membrane protein YoaK (UPF0700 family) [Rhizobium leguminosarum]|nr:uncharacterized membrane protein YoaK (UPF0700 family) [Rhizobium leguminosarum]MBB6298226.1 uncharacterized membrane protein YoaK (UPF0700 family) [Rhizobium leguminosarum]
MVLDTHRLFACWLIFMTGDIIANARLFTTGWWLCFVAYFILIYAAAYKPK